MFVHIRQRACNLQLLPLENYTTEQMAQAKQTIRGCTGCLFYEAQHYAELTDKQSAEREMCVWLMSGPLSLIHAHAERHNAARGY